MKNKREKKREKMEKMGRRSVVKRGERVDMKILVY
jgi:hypothetical protein